MNVKEQLPSRRPAVLVAAPADAAASACETLRRSPFLAAYEVVVCDPSAVPDAVAAQADLAAALIVPDDDGGDLVDVITAIHHRQRNPLMSVLVRSATLPPAVRDTLWDLGVADQQFDQALDDPALGAALAVALRDHARQQMHCAVAEASTALASAPTLGDQAALALHILAEQGFGRRGALFCFQRNSSGRHLLAITGSGVFAGVDCERIGEIADVRAAQLVQRAWNDGASLFAADFAVLYVGTRAEAHAALIALMLEAPLLPWQQRVLEVYAKAIAPAIEGRQHAQQLARTQQAMIATLAKVAEFKDPDTGEHIARVARMTAEIASHLARSGDCPEADDWLVAQIGRASILHDVGKVAIPGEVLLKPGALTAAEREIINRHALLGHDILREAAALAAHGEARLFHLASDIARYHHERWDGSGYPDGLRGEAIPLAARIVAVVDVFDALVSWRPYKEPWSVERALGVIREESGRHFDPRVVDAFFAVHECKAAARFIAWSDEMSVGHAELDRDHQRLIGILNNLGVNMELGNRNIVEFILDDLAHYADVHFRREESHLEQIGFADLVRHRKIHTGISEHIENAKWKYFQGFSATLESELLMFLTTWLNHHILVEDMRYSVRDPATPT